MPLIRMPNCRITPVPSSAEDFETRLATLEDEVTRLREQVALSSSDAVAARVLAAGANHDVAEVRAELRAHTQALNALRDIQLDHVREMREGFAKQATGMAQIAALLTKIAGSPGVGDDSG